MDKIRAIKEKLKQLQIPILLSLTLGLAPFFPEPHILSKLRWIVGGVDGMELLDWFDVLLHGSPWIYLFIKTGKVLN